MFIDGHEHADIVKYRKAFFEEMRLLLPYFVKFSNNCSILEKNYLDNCTLGELDERLIIMIT